MASIPGEPDGTPYSSGQPESLETVYDPTALHNFDATTLESDQEIGHVAQELFCDRSGFRVSLAEGLQKTWDGLMVRAEDWEPRHPLDFIRSRTTEKHKGSPRPEGDDVFLATNAVAGDDL